MNARGQAVDEAYGNGLWLQSHFKPLTGEMDTRQSGTGGSATNVQNLSYVWDTAGNLKERHDLRQALTETADYDELNRMWRTMGPAGTFTFDYDAVGNVQSRSDVDTSGAWTYSRNPTSITWTSANLPATITNGSINAQFAYAPDRSRWRQVADYAGGAETTLYIGGLLEKHTTPVRTHWKHLIATPSGEVQHVRRSDGTTDTFYLPSDHLGSVDAVLNASAAILVRTSFDAWGGRRDDDWVGAPSASEYQEIANTTRRGFGGHEMLDNVGLVHMNGRVYEPATGRMLSADPFVVPMLGSQGFNRYAYVGNQPLTYVDPSGFSPIDLDDSDDGWDFDVCIFCGSIYLGDRGRNPNPPRHPPGWGVVDGDPRNNPGTGGFEETARFTASVTSDNINVSTNGGTNYQGTWGDFALGLAGGIGDDLIHTLAPVVAFDQLRQGNLVGAYTLLRYGTSVEVFGAPDTNRGQFGYDLGPGATIAVGGLVGAARRVAAKGPYLVRFGKGPETLESLAEQSAKALANPAYGAHGVSTRLQSSVSRSLVAAHRCAARCDVEQVFPVRQTGPDGRHYTVVLPNPVTQEAVDLFNRLFRN